MMSRNPFRSNRPHQTGPQPADHADPADDAIIAEARSLYGSDAATAVAFCGLEAWFEDEEDEFRRFARLFSRLRN